MKMIAGTASQAAGLAAMNSKWMTRKALDPSLSRKEVNERAGWSQEYLQKKQIEEQAARERENEKMNSLIAKIASGQDLTADERAYLSRNNPQALQSYEELCREKKAYEEDLKNCRTKDEVERLKTQKMQEGLAAIKKADNNPNIPEWAVYAIAMKELGIAHAVEEVHQNFLQSARYQSLPSEAEIAEEAAKEKASETEENVNEIREGVQADEGEETVETTETKESAGAEETEASEKIRKSKEKVAQEPDEDAGEELKREAVRILWGEADFTGKNIDIDV